MIKNSSMCVANALLDIGAITVNFKKPYLYTFVSGIRGPMYCDNRKLLSYPEKRKIVVNEFLKVIKKLKFDIIGGVSTAGIPWATIIADKLDKPLIYIRPKPKSYGKKKQIEGDMKKGKKVLVVEDLVSTGGSAISVINTIRRNGGKVNDCVFIFSYELDVSKKNFVKAGCNMHPLLTFSDLVDVSTKMGHFSEKEKNKLSKWRDNQKITKTNQT